MTTPAACPSGRVDVALVVGGRWHDLDYARLRLLELLGRHDSVRATVHEDFAELGSPDAVVAYTCDVRPTSSQALSLRHLVESGGRLLALHATSSAIDAPEPGAPRVFRTPDAMPDFSALLGHRFLAHPRIGPFRIEVAQQDHPLAAGVGDFVTTDEIYVSDLAADLDVVMDVAYDGECPGFEVDRAAPGSRHPVLFSRAQGRGTVTSFTLGHCRGRFDLLDQGIDDLGVVDRVAWGSPHYREVLRRCVDWAVHGEDWPGCPAGQDGSQPGQEIA